MIFLHIDCIHKDRRSFIHIDNIDCHCCIRRIANSILHTDLDGIGVLRLIIQTGHNGERTSLRIEFKDLIRRDFLGTVEDIVGILGIINNARFSGFKRRLDFRFLSRIFCNFEYSFLQVMLQVVKLDDNIGSIGLHYLTFNTRFIRSNNLHLVSILRFEIEDSTFSHRDDTRNRVDYKRLGFIKQLVSNRSIFKS